MSSKHQTEFATTVTSINYSDTGFFSSLVTDYLQAAPALQPLYLHRPDLKGMAEAVEARKQFPTNRQLLVQVLKDQYKDVSVDDRVATNIDNLLQENTFTVTTAHQPNIFTGPLYFVYKILHAIRLAETLQQEMHGYRFVPVFYMGSEDADLDELGHFTVDGKRYVWQTKQTGAVGRMKVDKPFLHLLTELQAQITVLPNGEEMISLFREAYVEGRTLQHATLHLVNALFGRFGLVVLIPDNGALKSAFIPVLEKELTEQFSAEAVLPAKKILEQHYKVQASGRDINLFYLQDGRRDRIESHPSGFALHQSATSWTKEALLAELRSDPQRFSPNVILRGVFQETVLPNVAFIGGGGELAYWLELKGVFDSAAVPFPALVLRNSFLLMNPSQVDRCRELGIEFTDLFQTAEALLNQFVKRNTGEQLSLSEEIGALNSFYQQLQETTRTIDASLAEHVNALHAKAAKKIVDLEKKMLRAEKRKFTTQQERIVKLKSALFPGNSLQERVENISGFYGRYGARLIDEIFLNSPALDAHFTIITL